MKMEEIVEHWEVDSKIDQSEITQVTTNIPILHNKYYKMYIRERYAQKSMELELKRLKHEKFEFYSQGPNPDTPKEWKLPAIGKVLKSEVPTYVDTDPDIIKATLKLYSQTEKVDYLDAIIKMIVNRGYQVKSIIDWEKFKAGA